MFENTILSYEIEDSLFPLFQSDAKISNALKNIDIYNLSRNKELQFDMFDERYFLIYDFIPDGYYTEDEEEPFVDCHTLALFAEPKHDGQYTSIVMVTIEDEDAFSPTVIKIDSEQIIKALYWCILDIVYESYEHKQQLTDMFEMFWIPHVACLDVGILSGNCSPDDALFASFYREVERQCFDDFDVVFAHFNDKTRKFVFYNQQCEYIDFMMMLFDRKIWVPNNNLWLWSCNGGYTDLENRIPAVAYEIARRYNIEVKAAPGTIFLLDESGVRNYYIVDVHNTKWEHADLNKMRKRKKNKLIKYIKRHCISRDKEWLYFDGRR